jgi:hypothetical protein
MLSLLVFNRVYRLEIQPVTLIFRLSFVNYCPSALAFSLVHLPPLPLFPKSKEQNIQTVCGREGVGCSVVLETIFCRSLTLCI